MKTNFFAVKMLFLRVALTTLFLACALNTNGQYKKLTRGEPNPFDTAVAIQINQYRLETKKLKFGQQLVDSLHWEINSLYSEISLSKTYQVNSMAAIARLEKANTRKDSINQIIVSDFNKMYKIATAPEPWYKGPGLLYGTAGFIILLEIIKLFTSN